MEVLRIKPEDVDGFLTLKEYYSKRDRKRYTNQEILKILINNDMKKVLKRNIDELQY